MDQCDLAIVPDWIWGLLTVLQEARSESLDGMIAVAEVIRNRAEKKYSSDGTIKGTVLKPLQFSGWNTSDPNRVTCAGLTWDNEKVQTAIRAWKIAFNNRSDLTGGALLYHADYITPQWDYNKLKRTTKIDRHVFYALKD